MRRVVYVRRGAEMGWYATVVVWVLISIHIVFSPLSCARLPVTHAIAFRPWPTTAPLSALARAVDEADGYVLGTVEKAEAAWEYDDPCGIIAALLGRCDGTNAYKLTIRNADDPLRLYVFVPRGDSLALPVGTQAVFIWQFYYAARLQQCRAQAAMTMSYCPADQLAAVLSRDAVAAPGDSALVAWLFNEKRQS